MNNRTPDFSWGHININVTHLERSIEFYEKLGFELFIAAIPYLGLSADSEVRSIAQNPTDALGLPRQTRGRA
jgi:catechol 2,3-dioxygenase-like lactoylglutathione lyase family enzyme